MRLHLIRHAKTEEKAESGQDFDRRLLPRGLHQTQELSEYLKAKDFQQCTVLCSGAQRTQDTWNLISNSISTNTLIISNDIYLCKKEVFLEKIWSHHLKDELFIVAHNFGLSDLAHYFLENDLIMKTSEYLCIEFEIDQWVEASKGLGNLIDRYRSDV
jgi:phosphohistidine phosphatase